MQSAIALGERVEDLSQRSEFGSVFANPDGTWTAELAPEPVQVEDPATGDWTGVDTTLIDDGTGIRPVAAASDLVLSPGGDQVFARMTVDGQLIEWRWPTVLPAPVLDGATATYADVAAGEDLVVEATSTGFQHFVVLSQAPADGFEVRLPIAVHGADLTQTPQGGLVITDDGDVVVDAAPPVMWDSSTDAAGDPAVDAVDTTVLNPDAARPVVALTPDQGFLTDPDTVYPVTIDPSFSKYTNGDAWVQNAGYTTGQTSSPELRAGTYDSGTHKARSFIHFDNVNSTISGKQILSAKLVLRNFHSDSCTSASIKASKITQSWSGSSLTWGNQPNVGTLSATYSPAKGYDSSCPNGDATWDVQSIVQNWANDTVNNNGIRIAAVDETNNHSWRKYRSANYGTQEFRPQLVMTYNTAPSKPSDLQVVTDPASNAGYSTSTTPTFKAKVTDPEGGSLSTAFKVYNGAQLVGTQTVSVSSGKVASKTWPSALVDGTTYTLKVTATDASGLVSSTASKTFTVDTTVPSVVSIVSSAGLSSGAWVTTAPGSNTFTITGPSDVASFRVWEDDVLQAQTLTVTNNQNSASLAWNPQSNHHILSVSAIDHAGNEGAPASFEWGVGSAGVHVPDPDSVRTFGVKLDGPPNATGVNVQWRLIGDTWHSVTPAALTTTAGAQWAGGITTSGGYSTSGDLLWDPTIVANGQTVPAAPETLELKACFTYTSAPDQCGRGSMQLVQHAIGGNFPTGQLGPAMVGLQTGEAMLGSADAVDAAVGTARVFYSFDDATTTPGDYGLGWTGLSLTDGAGLASVVDNRDPSDRFVLQFPGWGDQTYLLADGSSDTYLPEGLNDGSKLIVDATTLTLIPLVGATTTWTLTNGEWVLDEVADPGTTTGSTGTDASGNVTFLSQAAQGTTSCNLSAQTAGCRGLKITKNIDGQVTQIDRIVGGAAPTSTTVATYTYTNQTLTSVCDPSLGTNICTHYTYTTVAGRTLVASITPNNQNTWDLTYDTSGRLTTVKRLLDGSTSTYATWTAKYDLPLTQTGIPIINATTAATWGQTKLPSSVAATWTPDRVPAATPTSTDMGYASVYWYNPAGAVTNTGANNGTTWLVDTTWYDEQQRPVQTLDGAGWADIQTLPAADRPAAAYKASSITVYNPTQDRVEDEYSPVHQATLTDGTTGSYRAHTAYAYDDEVTAGVAEGRPTLAAGQTSWNMVIDTTTSAANPDLTGEYDPQLVRNIYAPVQTGDGSGWDFGIPTQIKTQLTGGGWSTETNRINTDGRTIETRQPGGNGSDAHSTLFTYYTADNSSGDTDCNNKPKLDGLVCKTGPAGTAGLLPTTFNAAYNDDLQPTSIVETNAGTTRTTTNTYDGAGRIHTTNITITGGNTADPTLPTTTYAYYNDGTLHTQSVGGETITYTYDQWGRINTYTDASGLTSTTTYTPDGQTSTFNDGTGTYTYTYNHGLPATVDVGLPTGPDTFTYTWTNRGAPATITYPNGTTATYTYDELGAPTNLSYSNGTVDLVDYTNTLDVNARVVATSSNLGNQTYTYDNLGRLTTVQDTRDATAGCVTRTYIFSTAGERTGKTSYAPNTGGSCQTTTPDTTWTATYNAANQITNAGYTYDNLGRTRTTPAADTTTDATGPLTTTYYPNDMVATTTQQVDDGTDSGTNTTKTNTYDLDPTGRIALITSSRDASEDKRQTYLYSGYGDSPSHIQASDDGGQTWSSERNLIIPGVGYVGAFGSAVTLALSNLHGDIIGLQVEPDDPATLSSNSESDEYGLSDSLSRARYGWLGTHQRSSDAIGGEVLMGVRLYNPATGLFSSDDPILGGGATRYAYPTDPINGNDLTGQSWWCNSWCKARIVDGMAWVISDISRVLCGGTFAGYLLCVGAIGGVTGAAKYFIKETWAYGHSVTSSLLAMTVVKGAEGFVFAVGMGQLRILRGKTGSAIYSSIKKIGLKAVGYLRSKGFTRFADALEIIVWRLVYAIEVKIGG